MVVPRTIVYMDNQVISGCSSMFLVVRTWNIYTCKDEFWLQIYGCPSDCISIKVVRRHFWLSRAHGQPKCQTLITLQSLHYICIYITSIYIFLYIFIKFKISVYSRKLTYYYVHSVSSKLHQQW